MIDGLSIQYEMLSISISSSDGWVDLGFNNTYSQPIIVGGASTSSGNPVYSIAIKSLDSFGCKVRIFPPSNVASISTQDVYFFVIESSYAAAESKLSTGELFEAGNEFVSYGGFDTINFSQSFSQAPNIFATVSVDEGIIIEPDRYAVTRVRNKSQSGFDLGVFEEEGVTSSASIRINWLAIENVDILGLKINSQANITESVSSVAFNSTFFEIPHVVTQIQTYNEVDPAFSIVTDASKSDFDVKILEDTVDDSETTHAGEEVSYIACRPDFIQTHQQTLAEPQDYGFRVSLPGNDVLDDKVDPEKIIYSTEYSSPKILTEGTSSVTIQDGDTTSNLWTLNHNYGVPLAYLIYFKAHVDAIGEDAYFLSPSNLNWGAQGIPSLAQSDSGYWSEDMCDKDNLKFQVYRTGTTGQVTIPFKYYILLEPLEPFQGTLPTAGGDYGFQISKPGKDVIKGKSYDMAFTSSNKFFKLKDIVREKVGVPQTYVETKDIRLAFRHDLNYYPAFWSFIKWDMTTNDKGLFDMPIFRIQSGPFSLLSAVLILESYVTKTHFYLRMKRMPGYGTNPYGSPAYFMWKKYIHDIVYITTYEKLE